VFRKCDEATKEPRDQARIDKNVAGLRRRSGVKATIATRDLVVKLVEDIIRRLSPRRLEVIKLINSLISLPPMISQRRRVRRLES
jgi:hypothetical protein